MSTTISRWVLIARPSSVRSARLARFLGIRFKTEHVVMVDRVHRVEWDLTNIGIDGEDWDEKNELGRVVCELPEPEIHPHVFARLGPELRISVWSLLGAARREGSWFPWPAKQGLACYDILRMCYLLPLTPDRTWANTLALFKS